MSFLKKMLGLVPKPLPSTENVLRMAAESAETGINKKTFRLLNRLKANGATAKGIDYYRACYFLARRQRTAAVQAVKEELRYHPEHSEATALLESLQPDNSSAGEASDLFHVARAYTMMGEARLQSLHQHAIALCEQDVPGQFVECGVAAGGSSALLAGVISRFSKRDRLLYAFDTFEGMPEPGKWDLHNGQSADESGWGQGTCAAPESSLMKAVMELGAEKHVRPVKGLFADTLPLFRDEIGTIALLHVDGDWYQSTMDVLDNYYDLVVPGGIIQIDDYGYWQGCQKALETFERKRGIQLKLTSIDETGVWLEKCHQTE